MESCPQAVEIPVDTQRGCGGTIFRKVRMSQELRVRIDDDAHAYLKAVCTEHSLTLPQVVNALIWQAQQAKVEADTKLDVVLLQLQRMQALLEAVLAVPEAPGPAPDVQAVPLPVASYDALNGPSLQPTPAGGMEYIPDYFKPPPKRGLLNRLLYKQED